MSFDLNLERFFKSALAEDIGPGDITTSAIISQRQRGRAFIIAKQDGILSGVAVAARLFYLTDPDLKLTLPKEDGQRLKKGNRVMSISGKTVSILRGERTALNFLGHLSGIATLTGAYVDAVKPLAVSITDTRKTTPLWRYLEKKAVRDGGGVNHRHGLYDMVLIKENHIAAAGGIRPAIEKCRAYLKKHNSNVKIEVETKNLAEVREALQLKPDRIMLDNMDTKTMKKAVGLIAGCTEVEASGGVSLRTVTSIAACNVDFISIGALTHSAPAFDFSLLLQEDVDDRK